MSVVGHPERKEIFGEDGVLSFLLTYMFVLSDEMSSLQKVYAIATTQGVNLVSLTLAATPAPTTPVSSFDVKASPTSFGDDHLTIISSILNIEDQPWSSTTWGKRVWDQDESPLLDEDSPKQTLLFGGFA